MNINPLLIQAKNFAYSFINWKLSGNKPCPMDESIERAKICSTCPYNVDEPKCSKCSKIKKAIAEITYDFKRNRITPYDDKIKICKICGCINKIQIHVPLESLISDYQYPKHCWKSKL